MLPRQFASQKALLVQVDGLVERPVQLSLGELRALPARTQITRHDCVEGWSCIGKWTGVPLSIVLQRAGLKPDARYIVFYCADSTGQWLDAADKYCESIDMIDAFHPQTILAYDMNGTTSANNCRGRRQCLGSSQQPRSS